MAPLLSRIKIKERPLKGWFFKKEIFLFISQDGTDYAKA